MTAQEQYLVDVLDVSPMDYAARLAAASLQGLVNRAGAHLFLDYGIYDDISARTTNEVFLPEEIWREKFRPHLGNQDRENLEVYRRLYPMKVRKSTSLAEMLHRYRHGLTGAVVWDPSLPDTVNAALMLAGLENLIVLHPGLLELARENGLEVRHDLRGRWGDRLSLYRWALRELEPRCKAGFIACVEPGWERPEFADYLVQNQIFTFSLASSHPGRIFSAGQKLLLLLVAGPWGLRNLVFNLHLDGLLRRIGLAVMGMGSAEVRLNNRIQRRVKAHPFPTIFGWHTRRDDEFAFMLLLSANGLRLVPSHLAGNFSFHSRLPARVELRQAHATPQDVSLETGKVYLTFTLSDGDQLVLMDTAELGGWRRPERGRVPFNWEIQPLLAEMAPALLGQYYQSLTPNDYLIAGPSGAGYVIPPLEPRLEDYLEQTARICALADVRVLTSYIADPPARVVRQHGRMAGNILGFLAGYVHFGRTPQTVANGRAFVAYAWPHLDQIWHSSDECLEEVRKLAQAPGPTPRFIAVHLSAYKTTVSDVCQFVQTLNPARVKVVKADEFCIAAARHLNNPGINSLFNPNQGA